MTRKMHQKRRSCARDVWNVILDSWSGGTQKKNVELKLSSDKTILMMPGFPAMGLDREDVSFLLLITKLKRKRLKRRKKRKRDPNL